MSIHKSLCIRSVSNPASCSLGHDVREVVRMELKYFRMTRVDVTALPDYLFLSVSGTSSLYNNSAIHAATGNIPVLSSDKHPVYFKLERKYNDGVDPDRQYDVIHGKQIPGIAWEISNKSAGNMSNFEIYLYNETGNLLTMPPGSSIFFVFELVFSSPSNLNSDWKESRLFINHLNG